VQAQQFQLGVSSGPAFLYIVEDATTDVNYYEGISFQTDLVLLKEDQSERIGFSFYSNSIDAYRKLNSREFFRGRISNTGCFMSKYFVQPLTDDFSGNLQIGFGPNIESNYNGNTKVYFNINAALGLKYKISNCLSLTATGMAMGQDVPNIIRYALYDEGVEAGEDLHLIALIGLAYNWSK